MRNSDELRGVPTRSVMGLSVRFVAKPNDRYTVVLLEAGKVFSVPQRAARRQVARGHSQSVDVDGATVVEASREFANLVRDRTIRVVKELR